MISQLHKMHNFIGSLCLVCVYNFTRRVSLIDKYFVKKQAHEIYWWFPLLNVCVCVRASAVYVIIFFVSWQETTCCFGCNGADEIVQLDEDRQIVAFTINLVHGRRNSLNVLS